MTIEIGGGGISKLEALLLFFIRNFPRLLSRTELVKLVYLADLQHHKLRGHSFTGVNFARDRYGPYCSEVPRALEALASKGLIEIQAWSNVHGGITYVHSLSSPLTVDSSLNMSIDEERVAYFVLAQTQHLNLSGIKDMAYSTVPMRDVLAREATSKWCSLGEVLDLEKARPKHPKRSVASLRRAFAKINFENRGSDEEYAKVVSEEMAELAELRKRATKCSE